MKSESSVPTVTTISGTLDNPYEKFQAQAVGAIVKDFSAKLHGRYLLVIPTGGGKTFTAVRAVNRLFETNILDAKSDRVLWTAHREELLKQAKETFSRFLTLYPGQPGFLDNIAFAMIGRAEHYLDSHSNVKLVVIDEAHHAALKNISYGPVFAHSNLGILGLTATPSRHDGEPLEFERESFSIGFPDLVKKGIVLKPEVRKVKGGTYTFTDLDDDASLEQLNNKARNNKIIAELSSHPDDYKKVIIYVGTKKHVVSLYEQLRESSLNDKYEAISFITGDRNSRDQERDQFVEEEKLYKRSILVNVMVLSEGYDDPSVNTVVMATPSRSKLYYMQAMGRAIRHDSSDLLKKAYCVEVEDKLPNIRYRIENRWLYSDVSDALEPNVIDKEFGSAAGLCDAFSVVYDEYKVPSNQRQLPAYDIDDRYTMLLFKRYLAPGRYVHFPLIVTNANRLAVSNVFNFLSARMESYRRQGIVAEEAFRRVGESVLALLPDQNQRQWVYDAMKCAVPQELLSTPDVIAVNGYPWITFVAFHFCQAECSPELLQFVAEMVNRDDVLDIIKARDFETGSYLLRIPLPLKSYVGKFVTAHEFKAIDLIINKLKMIRDTQGGVDHRASVGAILESSIIPIELVYKDCLVPISRTNESYYMQLS